MVLTDDNYFSKEADLEYMSVSQFKEFYGSYGRLGCEFHAMKTLTGEWEDKPTSAMLVGSYVDSWFEGTLDAFKVEHPEIFRKDGTLMANFVQAEKIIDRVQRDEYFMRYMSGEKQRIMTGEIGGVPWKIKMDSYIPDIAIVDLKVMKSLTEMKWIKDIGYLDFVRVWGYDFQGAVYQEIVRQNTGKTLPFYIAGVSKEEEPDIRIVHVTDNYLKEALRILEAALPSVIAVKNGEREPDRCELCDCCRHYRVLSKPISIADLTANI
jgi:hypothetical protein